VEVINDCAIATDQFVIGVKPIPIVNLGKDTVFCKGSLYTDLIFRGCSLSLAGWNCKCRNILFLPPELIKFQLLTAVLLLLVLF